MGLDLILSVRNERGMEEVERWLKHQHRVYCLGNKPVEGDCSKRARTHCHTHRLGLDIGG
jgi:hypothetical protein